MLQCSIFHLAAINTSLGFLLDIAVGFPSSLLLWNPPTGLPAVQSSTPKDKRRAQDHLSIQTVTEDQSAQDE